MTFLLRFWKPLAGAAVLALIAWQIHAYGERREQDGRAAVQALWDADTKARDEATAKAIAAQAAAAEAQRKANEEIERDYEAKLAGVAADRDGVERMLREARDQVRRLAASAATGERGIDALAGIAARAAEVDRRLVEYDAACRADAVRLQALQDQIRPQL
jgi:biopolymer transport protein ExbB/TolQ